MFTFREVDINSEEDQLELYGILQKRMFNISHKDLPSFKEHISFVKKNSYRKWYLITDNNKKIIGSTYITNTNSIGISIPKPTKILYKKVIKDILKNHSPLESIKSIRSSHFLVNLSPHDEILREVLEELNFEHIQNTYAYIV
mgnify:CR=1 FL=1